MPSASICDRKGPMQTADLYADARFDLVTAANRFLFDVLPLRRIGSRQALEAFMSFIEQSRLPGPALDTILIRVLAILDHQTLVRLPVLLDKYLSTSTFSSSPSRFQECVGDLFRHRGIDDPDVEAAISFVEGHFNEPDLMLDDIAGQVGLLLDDLRQRFVSITGVSIEEYRRRLRLDSAAHQLATTDRSVKEIWVSIGYNFHENFCHDFKKRFGASPTTYRRSPIDATWARLSVSRDGTGSHSSSDRMRILLVDDNETFLDTAARLFRASGYTVKHSGNIHDGLGIAAREGFDAVVLDYHLGEGSGVEFLRSFRRTCESTPAVVFSADWTIEGYAEEIKALGATIMSKVTDFESLERLVRSLCAMPIRADESTLPNSQ